MIKSVRTITEIEVLSRSRFMILSNLATLDISPAHLPLTSPIYSLWYKTFGNATRSFPPHPFRSLKEHPSAWRAHRHAGHARVIDELQRDVPPENAVAAAAVDLVQHIQPGGRKIARPEFAKNNSSALVAAGSHECSVADVWVDG